MPKTSGSNVESALILLVASCPAAGSSSFGMQDGRTAAASLGSLIRRASSTMTVPPGSAVQALLLNPAAGSVAAGLVLTGSASNGFILSCGGGQPLADSTPLWVSASAARTIAEGRAGGATGSRKSIFCNSSSVMPLNRFETLPDVLCGASRELAASSELGADVDTVVVGEAGACGTNSLRRRRGLPGSLA